MKVLILYHAHCTDGFTAAWACRKGLLEVVGGIEPEEITVVAVTYDKLDDITEACYTYETIYIVDFSLPVEMLERFADNADVFVLDHHKTAMEMYAPEHPGMRYLETNIGNAIVKIDMDECGASLVWKFFFGERKKVPELIKYVKDYDLWQFYYLETAALAKYFKIQESSFSRWDKLANILEGTDLLGSPKAYLINEAQAMQTYHDSIVQQIVKTAVEIELAGERGLACNCIPQFASDVGSYLAEESGTFGATWHHEKGKIKVSLRSSRLHGNFDVTSLAKKFKGGGHHNAAGFYLDKEGISWLI